MKRRSRNAIIVVLAVAFVLVLASQSIVAFTTDQGTCNDPLCHTTATAIAVSTDASVDVNEGEQFSFVVRATATAGPTTLVLKLPLDLQDNALFNVPGDGLVRDGDAADLDPDALELEVNYTLTAPSLSGSYVLEIWAAGNGGHADMTSITVNVLHVGEGPAFSSFSQIPAAPFDNESVLVSVNISSEAGIASAVLQYRVNTTIEWTNVTMNLVGGFYQATIPRFPPGTTIEYRIVARDGNGIEVVTDPPLKYTVRAIPPIQMHYGFYLGAPALILAYLGTALEYYDEERFTRIHGFMLTLAYFLTLINVLWLFQEDPGAWTALNPSYLINPAELMLFIHSWHIWLGIISMILGTLAIITHIAGWKTCNLGLPAVLMWTILGLTGFYLNAVGFLM
ncbi:MAG: hypothetical protein ACFFAD_15625 [Candidatus Hermodarchaeota archaeon]